jgi:leucyl-tRNA synthetase
MRRYNPKEIEPKWQQVWRGQKLYEADTTIAENKFYIIPMFPYPSGDLHIGHWYNFAPTDTVARWQRMRGHRVLHTNGFDAFGLPAENAAIKHGIPPAEWTKQNIESMTKQIEAIGASYDWTKSVKTNDPNYYHWTQWIFIKLFEKSLAYRAKGLVNWCPKDQTVLANEQVIGEKNVCERCGTPVIQKELEQWFFKITDYAERLLSDLEKVDWPQRVRLMQENWIGKSDGALVNFDIEGSSKKVEVFTTRPDTIFGATYMVLAPEHPLVEEITTDEEKEHVTNYLEETIQKTELERKEAEKKKTGVFTGAYAINPATDEKIPVWLADYVLMSYGSGAIMAVPAHDERDGEFAQKFNLPIVEVIEKPEGIEGFYSGEGKLKNSGGYNGLSSNEAREKIVADFSQKGTSKEQTNYKLRDWLISRQRYWGVPIPIVYCEKCGVVPVPEKDLPVLLPESVHFEPTGQSPLLQNEEFVNTKCPNCDGPARRETDTMDTFVDSSWYFLRYPDPNYEEGPFNPEVVNKWAPVDHYIGGIEHAILHLLYARFITKFLHDHHGLAFDEPFKKLSNQGIILGPDGQKMSKSRGNVVSPDEQVTSYGADSLRLYMMFMGPYDQGGPYALGGIAGTRRFLDRVWTLLGEFLESKDERISNDDKQPLLKTTHRTIKKVTHDLEKMDFNTAIAAMMALVNELYRIKANGGISQSEPWRSVLEALVRLLAPFAPHIAEEMWFELSHEQSVHLSGWPQWDEALVIEETITIAVQVNGKVRAEIKVAVDITEQDVINQAKEEVKEYLDGKETSKTIYVPGRLVSLVV